MPSNRTVAGVVVYTGKKRSQLNVVIFKYKLKKGRKREK
jgi:hypothetical protein